MLLYIIGLIGVAVFSLSGALEAGRKKFDLMGVAVVAVVTAIGGGTIRDLLLNRPVFWVIDPNFLTIALLAAVITFFTARFYNPPRRVLLVADALGLALFAISGAQLAEQAGLPAVIAVVMGTITGVAGGVLRDVLCAEVPLLFRPAEPWYATAAICGTCLYIALHRFGMETASAALLGMFLIAALRLLAIVYGLHLPGFRDRNDSA